MISDNVIFNSREEAIKDLNESLKELNEGETSFKRYLEAAKYWAYDRSFEEYRNLKQALAFVQHCLRKDRERVRAKRKALNFA